jgi:hypothetical protein
MSDIIFIEPNDDDSLRPCALVLKTEGNGVLVAMAHPDIHIAGHLDIVLVPSSTLPCAIAVFSHATAWVPSDCIASVLGTVSDSVIEIVLDAGAGVEPPKELRGFHLADPLIDPRAEAQVILATKWFDIINELTTNA